MGPLLRKQSVVCGRDALFTLLRGSRMLVAPKRRYTKTTDSHHRFRQHPNLVKDRPPPTTPNQLWGSDSTYLPTGQGTLYLSLVTDAYSRRLVGCHIHASLHTAGCLAALAQAVRGAGHAAGCLHHSDRGSQYCADSYQHALQAAGLRCSMTKGTGDCYQNALAERVNGILKDEFLFLVPEDLAQARVLVEQAVNLYNEERPYLALHYLTPNQGHQVGKSPAGKSEPSPALIPVNV
jgi:putative transposase